ncbi:hypothetical protein UFOVP1419_25 [uncultured Caudovirales phage]|uniref:Uncharacterized protein n=1 Tax=uncultured Caudovirales phage TaxID=2100421 RepID=A0A6J5SDY2_9CAUD|nr:hypothetical protein UFOVP1419_25 [uncultured Caudovirales phage]
MDNAPDVHPLLKHVDLEPKEFEMLEREDNAKRKAVRFKYIMATCMMLFLFYGYFLVEHLQEEHGAGHHVIYFLLVALFFLFWSLNSLAKHEL